MDLGCGLAGENLPADFAKIPEDSDMGTVLYAVPGTELAREAVLDAQIPQTAVVNRKTATLEVEYDGEPEFEPIDGTSLTYAVNSPTPVIKYEVGLLRSRRRRLVRRRQSTGQVAGRDGSAGRDLHHSARVTDVLRDFRARSISHTDDEVNVGYTSGYTGTYVYNTTVVYGTGYYYPGWYGTRCTTPRPSTWGFHVRYNPWTGWSFGLSYSNGPFTFYDRTRWLV